MLNQKQATGLLVASECFTVGQIVHALVTKDGSTRQPIDISAGSVEEVDPEPSTYAEGCAFVHANVWEGAISLEFEGLLLAGMFTFIGSVPKGINVVNAN